MRIHADADADPQHCFLARNQKLENEAIGGFFTSTLFNNNHRKIFFN